MAAVKRLFNHLGKPVFDADNKPVFALVRDGSVAFTLSANYQHDAEPNWGIAAGNVAGSLSVQGTRTAYGAFTLDLPAPDVNGVIFHTVTYLGKDTRGYNYYYWMHLMLGQVSFAYSTSAHKFLLKAFWFGSISESATNYFSPINVESGLAEYTKSSSLLIPEGSYATSPSQFVDSQFPNWGTLTLAASVSVSFNEA